MNKATYKKTSSNTLACISSHSLPTILYQRRKTVWNGAATCRRVVAPSSVPEVRAVPWWTLLLRALAAINCFMNLLLIITSTRWRAREDRGRTLSPAGAATSIKNTWTPQSLHSVDPFRLSGCGTATTNQSRLQSSTTPPKRTLGVTCWHWLGAYWDQTPNTGLRHPSFNHCRI